MTVGKQAPIVGLLLPTAIMSASLSELAFPKSILDTDLYKVSSIFWAESFRFTPQP